MFSFFRKNKKNTAPEWASFFSGDAYTRFIKAVRIYFDQRGLACSLNENDRFITVDQTQFGSEQLGLVNLGQMVAQAPPDAWTEIITNHFDGILNSVKFSDEFDQRVHDFSFVREYIGVRLYHNDYFAGIEDGLKVGKQMTSEVFAALIFDHPNTIVNIRPEQTIQWNKTYEELFEIGLQNIRQKYPSRVTRNELEGINFYTVLEDHFFTGNFAFELNNHDELRSGAGCLVSFPHRHAMFIYPITNLEVIQALNALMPVTNGMFNEGPGSIAENIYWFRDGEFIDLPYKIEEKAIKFTPPESFLNLLSSLGQP